jgi:hypothetical protein
MRKKLLKGLILSVLFCVLTASALTEHAEALVTWHTETADTGRQYTGEMGYDAAGYPGFAQIDYYGPLSTDRNGYAYYRHKTPAGWVSEAIGPAYGIFPRLAFDSGQPAMLYNEPGETSDSLIYAKRSSDGIWTKTAIASYKYGTDALSLKFNSAGQPCATYSISGTLYYATYNGTAWKSQVVFSGGEIYYADLAFNGTVPAVAFCAGRWGGGLQYAQLQGSTWTVQTVDSSYSGTYRNRQASITLRFGNGKPLITFDDEDTRSLKFAYPAGQGWQIRELEGSSGSRNYTGESVSMQVAQHAGYYTVYILHSNFTVNQTSSIKLKTLTVNNDGDLANPFSSQTLYSKNFGNMTPWMGSGLKDGNPGVVFLEFHAGKTTYISMQPDIQAVSSVAFGAVADGNTETRTVTITNNGSVNLSISEITAPAAPFAVTGGDFSVLAPGASGTLTVSFTPPAAGVSYQGTLTVRSNDPDEAVFNITLTGRSIGVSAALSGISFNNGATLPILPDITAYSLEVAHATDTIRVKPAAAHAYAAITVNGTAGQNDTFSGAVPLAVGDNTITVTVTSEDGNTIKTYTLTVTRRASPDATLSSLTVSAGALSPDFSPEILAYTVTLPDGVSEISFTPTVTKAGATVSLNGTSITSGQVTASLPAGVGENTYTLHVVAPDVVFEKDYVITVLRKPELGGLTLNHGVLDTAFTPYTTSYAVVVPNSVTALTVTPTSAAGSISVNGTAVGSGTASDPVNLEVGITAITVAAVSADGETSRTYTLTVTRLEGLYALSAGDTQVMYGLNDFALSVDITDAACPLYLGVPDGMSVKVDGVPATGGISESFSFNEGQNSAKTIELISPECSETTVYTLTVTRRPLLTSLTVAGSTVTLRDDETVYVPTVENTSVTATIQASANEGTTVVMDGSVNFPVTGGNGSWTVGNLHVGANPIYLRVTSQDGHAETVYTIVLKRQPELSSLSVSEGELTPVFDADTLSYTVNVGRDIDSIALTAGLQTDGTTGFEIGSLTINGDAAGSGVPTASIPLSYGGNVIYAVVTTNSYVSTVYSVTVVRQEPQAGSIAPTSASFDRYTVSAGYRDIELTVTISSVENPLLSLKKNGNTLAADTDYTVSGGTYTIKKEYLAALQTGQAQLIFDFAYGPDPVLTVNVMDSSPSVGSPVYDAAVAGGGNVPVTVDTGAGTASVDMGSVAGSIAGGGDVVVDVPPVPGVDSYSASLPSDAISGSGDGTLTLNTHLGSVTIPGSMLTGTGLTGEAAVTIGAGDKSVLPDEVKAALGDKPLISLSLSIDGRQTGWSNPDAPVTVAIPYTPTAEELLSPESIVIWYIDGSGNAVSIPSGRYDPVTGTITFSTTHFSLYAVGFNNVRFNDVAADAWYGKAVGFIAARGITGGTGGGSFSPDKILTRGEFIVMLLRAYTIAPDTDASDNFSDAGSTYYTGYLAAAKRLGISAGIGSNLFAPDRAVTRQELFTLLYNALKAIGQLPIEHTGVTLGSFADAGQIASWARDAMTLLAETGTISGSGGRLNPTGTCTRAEMAQTLYNLMA